MTVRIRWALSAFALTLACTGCRRGGTPPLETFVPGVFHPPMGKAVFTPPEPATKPWRVMMLQREPRPVKNPTWLPLPIQSAGELEMPQGSAFRCLYNPVKYRGVGDESMKGVEGWEILREVRCTNDGWRTYSATGLVTIFDAGGRLVRKVGEQAELELFETLAGRPTHISILLRPD